MAAVLFVECISFSKACRGLPSISVLPTGKGPKKCHCLLVQRMDEVDTDFANVEKRCDKRVTMVRR